jgi:hypothetical protein
VCVGVGRQFSLCGRCFCCRTDALLYAARRVCNSVRSNEENSAIKYPSTTETEV